MLNTQLIKESTKKKGFTLDEVAKQIGMSYNGFYKALKKGILRHERKVLLSEIIDLSVEQMELDPPNKNKTVSAETLIQMLEDKKRIIYLQEQEIKRLNEDLAIYRKNN